MGTNCLSLLNITKFLKNNTSKICDFIAAFYITVLKDILEWCYLPSKYSWGYDSHKGLIKKEYKSDSFTRGINLSLITSWKWDFPF